MNVRDNVYIQIEKTEEKYPLSQSEVRIGRQEDNDIVVNDNSVSRKHAVLTREPDGWYIADCGSSNGVVVDDEKLEVGERHRLHNNSRILLASKVLLSFHFGSVDPRENEYQETGVLTQESFEPTVISSPRSASNPPQAARPYKAEDLRPYAQNVSFDRTWDSGTLNGNPDTQVPVAKSKRNPKKIILWIGIALAVLVVAVATVCLIGFRRVTVTTENQACQIVTRSFFRKVYARSFFDPESNAAESVELNEDGAITSATVLRESGKTVYLLDGYAVSKKQEYSGETERLISETTYTQQGSSVTTFDDSGNPVEVQEFDKDGVLYSLNRYENGILVESTIYGDAGYQVLYYENAGLVQECWYDSSDELQKTTDYETDGSYKVSMYSFGVITEAEQYDANNILQLTEEYEDGILTKQSMYRDGNVVSELYMGYDSFGELNSLRRWVASIPMQKTQETVLIEGKTLTIYIPNAPIEYCSSFTFNLFSTLTVGDDVSEGRLFVHANNEWIDCGTFELTKGSLSIKGALDIIFNEPATFDGLCFLPSGAAVENVLESVQLTDLVLEASAD